MIYNKPDTMFFKTAAKMRVQGESLLEEASQVIQETRIDPASGVLVDSLPSSYFLRNQVSHTPSAESIQQPARGNRRRSSSDDRRKGKQRDAEPFNFEEKDDNDEEEEIEKEPSSSFHPLSSYLDFGQKVKAKWTNGQFYQATVCLVRRESNTVQVVFDDGLLGVRFFLFLLSWFLR